MAREGIIRSFFDFVIAFVLFLVIDQIYLGVIAKTYYLESYAHVQGSPVIPRLIPALISYILLAFGFTIFVLPRIYASTDIKISLLLGGLYGAILYGFNDLSSQTVFTRWSNRLSIVDTAWGGTIGGIVSTLIHLFHHA